MFILVKEKTSLAWWGRFCGKNSLWLWWEDHEADQEAETGL